jgi:signal transduction histidine kinase
MATSLEAVREWKTFERLCADLLEAEQLVVTKEPSVDTSGWDLQAVEEYRTHDSSRKLLLRWRVQCKHYAQSGRNLDRTELESILVGFEAVRGPDEGLLIMISTDYTEPAHRLWEEYAAKHPQTQVQVWNARQLLAKLHRHPHLIAQYGIAAADTAADRDRDRTELKYLVELAQISRSTSARAALGAMVRKLATYFPPEVTAQFMSVSDDQESLVIDASTAPAIEGVSIPVANSVAGLVVQSGASLYPQDIASQSPGFVDPMFDFVGCRIRSELAVPVIDDEQIIGVLSLQSPRASAFTERDVHLLELLANAGIWYRLREVRRDRAVESMAVIGDVAANLMHVLNNFLASLHIQASHIVELAPQVEPPHPLKTETSRLMLTIADFADRIRDLNSRYQRALEGNIPTDMHQLATDAAKVITRQNVHVAFDLDEALPKLRLPAAMSDVLWNLLSNANEAIPEGTPGTITIGASLKRSPYTSAPQTLEMYVADTGVGIEEAGFETIFALGRSERRDATSRGYGLWWVKMFVNRCGGAINIESEVGKGSTFRLSFALTPSGEIRGLAENRTEATKTPT